MEKEFEIKSIDDFNKILLDYNYLNIIPKVDIEKFLNYQGYVMIKEVEDPITLFTKIQLQQSEGIKDIFYKLEIIKENLNKYAKEGIEHPDECTIEKVRENILKIKEYFGEEWRKEYIYDVDKYKKLRSLLRLMGYQLESNARIYDYPMYIKEVISEMLLLADGVSKERVILGNSFAERILILLSQSGLIKEDMGLFLSSLLNILGEKDKKVQIDFRLFNKRLLYSKIDITSNGNYTLSNLDCPFLRCNKGRIVIRNSKIDKLMLSSPELEKVILENVVTGEYPTFSIKKERVITKKVVTYGKIKIKNKRKGLINGGMMFFGDKASITT